MKVYCLKITPFTYEEYNDEWTKNYFESEYELFISELTYLNRYNNLLHSDREIEVEKMIGELHSVESPIMVR